LAGIYIHIPFCRQKCHYCNFFSIASVKNKARFLSALIGEIRNRKDYLDGEPIETLYFGGGTPSLFSNHEINRIYLELEKFHIIEPNAEITLEANPDDISREWIRGLKETPVNRLSIGIQSFFDADLLYLNRIHSGIEALESVKMARDAGYNNLTIDLIYGIPTLGTSNWIKNLELFMSLGLKHLSAYALTVEPKTALPLLIGRGKLKPVSDSKAVVHFKKLVAIMEESGFIQYEISNFCKEDLFSKHNKSYWTGKKYLGLGPSAHSFNGNSRQWNPSNLTKYLTDMEQLKLVPQLEVLTTEQKFNEYILTSLRTVWGTDLEHIRHEFGLQFADHFKKNITKHIEKKFVVMKQDILYLTNEGKLFADRISSELFV
jgi:oxygen-independent coproporphyrinogen-3 oxidase